MPFGCPLRDREDCDQGTSSSSRPRTNHYTTHVRFRTSQINRKHSAVIVRPVQDRSSNEHGSQDVTLADHCPKGRPFPVSPAGTEIPGMAEMLTPAGDLRTLPCGLADPDPRMAGLDGFFAARLERM